MRRLDLDFCRIRPASPWAGWVLIVIAAAFIAELGVSYLGAREALVQKQQRLAQLGRPTEFAKRTGAGSQRVSAEEIAFAAETIRRLATPWDTLFTALESAASDDVALLAIDPDPASGTVVISGESRNYLTALSYVLDLRRAKTLSRVQLLKHELRQNDPRRPVAFSISASWREAR
jgi:hypothetical protein